MKEIISLSIFGCLIIVILLILHQKKTKKNFFTPQNQLLPVPERTVVKTIIGAVFFGTSSQHDIKSFYADVDAEHQKKFKQAKIRLAKYLNKKVSDITDEQAQLEYARWEMLSEMLEKGNQFPSNHDFTTRKKKMWYLRHMARYQIGKRKKIYPNQVTDADIHKEVIEL